RPRTVAAPLVSGRAGRARAGPDQRGPAGLPRADPSQVAKGGELDRRGARALWRAAAVPRPRERVGPVLPVVPAPRDDPARARPVSRAPAHGAHPPPGGDLGSSGGGDGRRGPRPRG